MYKLIYTLSDHYNCYFNRVAKVLNDPEMIVISSEDKFALFKLCGSFIKSQVGNYLAIYPNGSMYDWQDNAAKKCYDILQKPNLSIEDYITVYLEFDKFGDCEADNFFIYEDEELLYHSNYHLKSFSNVLSYYDKEKFVEITLEKALDLIENSCFD